MKKTLFLFLFSACIANAQHTITFNENAGSPVANLKDMSWLAGHWRGEAFGGITEEIWSPPLGDSMMFVFKLVSDNAVGFYEIGHIRQIDETLVLQLKHFHGDLKGWEEKEETVNEPPRKKDPSQDRVSPDDNETFDKVSVRVLLAHTQHFRI